MSDSRLKKFNRTAFNAEKESKERRNNEDAKLCKTEIYSSINHILISFEKFLDNTTSDELENNKEHIDNVYYHIGKIKGFL